MRFVLLALLLAGQCFAGHRFFKVRETSDVDLFWSYYRFHGLTVTFQTTGPVDVTTLGHVNLKHRCFPGVTAVGYAVAIYYKYATTPEGLNAAGWTWLATSSGNITSCAHHYADAGLDGYARLTAPGWYRVEVWGKSHSSDAPGVDGLLEVNNEGGGTVNQLIVRVEDAP